MKKLLIIAVCLFVIPAVARGWFSVRVAGENVVASATPTPTPTPPAYLFIETFETATGYDKTWTEWNGNPNPDYATSPAPLKGSESLSGVAGDGAYSQDFTGQTEAYVAFRYHIPTLVAASFYACTLSDTSGNILARIQVRTDGTLRLLSTGGTTLTDIPVSEGVDVAMMIYWHAIGVDQTVVTLYVADVSSGAWGTADASGSDGDWTAAVGRVQFDFVSTSICVAEQVVIDTSAIPFSEMQ